jgi:hypothetical protein
MWTLQGLADAAELSLTDPRIAAERLVLHGEMVRNGRERYARPVTGDEGL